MKHNSFNFHSVNYYVSEAFRNLIRNSLMTLSSIATVASCILIVVFSYCVASNIDYVLEQIENSVPLSAFIDETLEKDRVETLRNQLLSIEHVEKVEYVSPDQALKSFSETLGDAKDIIKGLENDNPLRPSFTITLDNSKYQNVVIDVLQGAQMKELGVVNVRHARDTMNLLISVNNLVRIISIVIILILGVLAVIIIMNTIKLTVNSRRHEITIMKYVGATDWFIKWPFVIEGVLIGLFGAALPVILFWAGYSRIIGAIYNSYEFLRTLIGFREGIEIFPVLIPLGIFLGSLIGILGSISSMRKHLNV